MKKYLRYGNWIALGAGAVGMVLAAWLFSAGTDEKGLYPANHPAWILLGILTVAVVAILWLLTRKAGVNRNFRQNFPNSIPATAGCAAAVIGLLAGSFGVLATGKNLGFIAAALGVFAAISLGWSLMCRIKGQRSTMPAHILPCFFFALQLFVLGQEFGSEPEMYRYLYRFWAAAAMVPACYCLWSFDVNLGNRPDCLFWCLVAGYCNLVASVGSGQALMHLGIAAWMLTAMPKLGYLPRSPKPATDSISADTPISAEEPIITEEIPNVADFSKEITPIADPLAEQLTAPTANSLVVDLPDADAILEELLRDLKQQENP